ncbi:replication initiator protein A [Streptococcus iners]|uniref:Replication initiator protein A n=1 Tax=Streptococcus iners TaxID=3028084 RepID=A0AA97AEQ6_9STRE|nr:replication initiator protein A [Streptococcus sp. 29887]MCK4025755.1 DnaD domain protein [Streptococcus suis]WNY51621.1 replication initiator protein A [Streptococcus sp. 29887]
MESKYFTVDDFEMAQFYQMPKNFFHGEKYRELSGYAKLLYMIAIDRHKLSIKNNYIDGDGRVYHFLTVEAIQEILGISKPTAIKTKKELIDFGLLEEKKTFNQASKLYLIKYVVSKNTLSNEVKNLYLVSKKSLPTEVKNFYPNNTELNNTELNNINNNTSEQNPLKKIVYTIRQNWGKDLTPIELETVTKMLGDYPFEIIDFAISEATLRNKKTIRWVERCCLDWYVHNNLETVTAIQDYLLAKKSWTRKEVDTPDPNYPPPY